MREIISLQFGERSNYLATHFWNIQVVVVQPVGISIVTNLAQESYFTYSDKEQPAVDHDVHFRAGIGADGSETFTPRTVIYDLKGGFGSLRKYNALYELSEENPMPRSLWNGNTLTHKQPAIEPNEYQKNLDQGLPTSQLTADQVRYWSDFNRVFYHPRSIVQLNEYELHSELTPFENWSAGQDLFHNLDKESTLLDRDVRPFAEECDHLAGFQVFTSTDDAWGGFASTYVDALRDEFGKNSIWLWGLEDGLQVRRQSKIRRTANVARSLQGMVPQVSAFVRLSNPPVSIPPNVTLDLASEWSRSALLCTAVETVTLPSRLREGKGRTAPLTDLEGVLNPTGSRTIFDLKAGILAKDGPESGRSEERAKNVSKLDENESFVATYSATTYDIDYSPRGSQSTLGSTPHFFNQVEVRRCIVGHGAPSSTLADSNRTHDRENVVEIYPTKVPLPGLDGFPHTLIESLDQGSGFRAALVTSSETSTRLRDMSHLIKKVLEVDTREVLVNDLAELAGAYEEDWQSSSDSGGDE